MAKVFPYGCRTRIVIGPNLYLNVTDMAYFLDHFEWRKHIWDCEYTPELLLFYRFILAETLVHELGHAFNMATMGHPPTQPSSKDSLISEGGLQLEAGLWEGKPYFSESLRLYKLADSSSHFACKQLPFSIEKKRPRPFLCIRKFPAA